MSVIFIVLPLAIILAIAFVIAFSWCVRSGQYDDVDTPALRILDTSDEGPGRPGGRRSGPAGAGRS